MFKPIYFFFTKKFMMAALWQASFAISKS